MTAWHPTSRLSPSLAPLPVVSRSGGMRYVGRDGGATGYDHWPEATTKALHALMQRFNVAQAAAHIHYTATGARTPFHASKWSTQMTKAGGYGGGRDELGTLWKSLRSRRSA